MDTLEELKYPIGKVKFPETITNNHIYNWAKLSDTNNYNISELLQLLKSLHQRWVFLLNSMTAIGFKKCFIHPDENELVSLEKNLCIYEWHCNHHLQHIKNAKKFQY
jgi:hypothetical protein